LCKRFHPDRKNRGSGGPRRRTKGKDESEKCKVGERRVRDFFSFLSGENKGREITAYVGSA